VETRGDAGRVCLKTQVVIFGSRHIVWPVGVNEQGIGVDVAGAARGTTPAADEEC
jgi:hypothetical protein